MMKSGEFATITELAECEGIASSYMTRVLRLTLAAWQHEWLAAKVNDFHRAFLNRVRDLDADEWQKERAAGDDTGQEATES
ncbi:hypothetical protein [Paracoccus salsus]|uniref:hypothetical protein n=1 Tax=Paracoccus salsus TaxID=2911061 RepID=UPI001F1AD80F|nr:hypothetical protein [Paracoccus salsus]MCF3975078.1 hypothetical protein [Paracoccus salsus]